MNEQSAVALANLLSVLIPMSIRAYNEIAANHSNVKPIAEIIASADADWDEVIAKAKHELNKLGQ